LNIFTIKGFVQTGTCRISSHSRECESWVGF